MKEEGDLLVEMESIQTEDASVGGEFSIESVLEGLESDLGLLVVAVEMLETLACKKDQDLLDSGRRDEVCADFGANIGGVEGRGVRIDEDLVGVGGEVPEDVRKSRNGIGLVAPIGSGFTLGVFGRNHTSEIDWLGHTWVRRTGNSQAAR